MKRDELLARIEAAKAAQQEIADSGAEFRELQALEAEAEAAEIAVKDAAAILAAEKATGRQGHMIEVIRTRLGCIILGRPNKTLYRKFCDESESAKQEDIEALVRKSRLYPDEAEFSKILSELPGTLGELGAALGRLAGVQSAESRGKA